MQQAIARTSKLSGKKIVHELEQQRQKFREGKEVISAMQVGALIERLPVVQKAPEKWELDYWRVRRNKVLQIESKVVKGLLTSFASSELGTKEKKDKSIWLNKVLKLDYVDIEDVEKEMGLISPPDGSEETTTNNNNNNNNKQLQQQPSGKAAPAPQMATKEGKAKLKKQEDASKMNDKFAKLGISLNLDAIAEDADDENQWAMQSITKVSKVDESEKLALSLERITDADRNNDVKSLKRKLDESLFLVLKKSNGTWALPHTVLNEGEFMMNAASRVSHGVLNKDGKLLFVSHCPHGYREVVMEGKRLEFIYRCQLLGGEFDLNAARSVKQFKDVNDFAWLTGEVKKRWKEFVFNNN